MPSQKNKELVELYPNIFVPKEEVEAHTLRMSQEMEAKNRSDTMSPEEEREWEIAARIRGEVKEKIDE